MGAGQSQAADEKPSRGLHILRVTPSSPASQTDLEPFFDFVIGLEGKPFASDIDASELERIVESNENNPITLLLVVTITPSRVWSSSPDDISDALSDKPSLLGLSMRLCEPEFSLDNVWHVLDVLEGSPAESAGLVPYGDWIVGWSGGVLHAESDFYQVVEAHVEKPLRVYVYSYDFDAIREVVLVPNRQWGGEGLLGCVFGFGLLHRIPVVEPGSTTEELVAAHETTTEADYEEHALFVPADEHANTVFKGDDETLSFPQESFETDSSDRNIPPSSTREGLLYLGGEELSATPTKLTRQNLPKNDLNGDQDEDGDSVSVAETTGSITSVD
ncbi:hypothetical protein Clacol_007572 [Clathrus columnatus]|uniref:PDZ GRASP-type domain-containing protein n=1 Tax=Clathrus columnatus TaxID=1419009 RepID=A0AAV5AG60_9AGAM|nr:hypothetical protein Clacol_007572 [Clathrus columnatus]